VTLWSTHGDWSWPLIRSKQLSTHYTMYNHPIIHKAAATSTATGRQRAWSWWGYPGIPAGCCQKGWCPKPHHHSERAAEVWRWWTRPRHGSEDGSKEFTEQEYRHLREMSHAGVTSSLSNQLIRWFSPSHDTRAIEQYQAIPARWFETILSICLVDWYNYDTILTVPLPPQKSKVQSWTVLKCNATSNDFVIVIPGWEQDQVSYQIGRSRSTCKHRYRNL